MKVSNLKSYNGNYVPNQFKIEKGESIFFQSYDSIIGEVKFGKVYVSSKWDYSATTTKYLVYFLESVGFPYHSKNDIRNGISSGDILIKNLTL